jgi:hypothetical protein
VSEPRVERRVPGWMLMVAIATFVAIVGVVIVYGPNW